MLLVLLMAITIYKGGGVVGPRNPIQRLANRSKPAVDQQRVTLRGLLLESRKWMILMITNIEASLHHGRDQSLIVIRNLMKPCKSPKKHFACCFAQ